MCLGAQAAPTARDGAAERPSLWMHAGVPRLIRVLAGRTPCVRLRAELKKCLYAMFSQYGKVIDVVALKTQKLRGQAWVVYSDVAAATNALRTLQGFPFFDKPIVSSGWTLVCPAGAAASGTGREGALAAPRLRVGGGGPCGTPASGFAPGCGYLWPDLPGLARAPGCVHAAQRISYAKTKSDAVAKLDGSFKGDKKRKKEAAKGASSLLPESVWGPCGVAWLGSMMWG